MPVSGGVLKSDGLLVNSFLSSSRFLSSLLCGAGRTVV